MKIRYTFISFAAIALTTNLVKAEISDNAAIESKVETPLYTVARDTLNSLVEWSGDVTDKLADNFDEVSESVCKWSDDALTTLGSGYQRYRNIHYLESLVYSLEKEEQRAKKWDKALAQAEDRAEKVITQLDEGEGSDVLGMIPERERFESLQYEYRQKRVVIQSYVRRLHEKREGIPKWINLIDANGFNRSIEQELKDTELLLSYSQNLTENDWMIRSPEQLWLDLEKSESSNESLKKSEVPD